MKRAFLIELTIFRDYGIQLLGLGLLVSVLVGVGMQTVLVAPSVITTMFFMMGVMAAAAYDEQNDWGRFRLTMPLSRRDVVLGRYGAIVVLGLSGMVIGLAAAFLVSGLAAMGVLPNNLAAKLVLDSEATYGMAFSTALCMFIGATVASVVAPVYFKLGQTKATQYLPTVIVLLFILPVIFLANSGLFDNGIPGLDAITSILELLNTSAGVTVICAVLVVLSAIALSVSAFVSLKLYESREL
ncbi:MULTISPECIES: ABC-2 transporter permease [unclassified Adlercreutzia]|uniref:ABC-2 transporter permease n=1 Tax=unclassified Adlercreutzia TaxID=2636013 RepID=UPI0013EC491E|nr:MULTISPECIES: ABC-2 transporter permease [unclassified Adlercreutzia]